MKDFKLEDFIGLEGVPTENEFFDLENGDTITTLTNEDLYDLFNDGTLTRVEHPTLGTHIIDPLKLYVKVRGRFSERTKD